MTFLKLRFVFLIVVIALTLDEVRSSQSRWAEEPALIPPHLRSHFRDNNNLSPLSEDELETLLFLLDKVGPSGGGGSQHERRSKRTGHFPQQPRSKKSTDWSNYFGIDKRSAHAPANLINTQETAEHDETVKKETAKLGGVEGQGQSQSQPEHEHDNEHEVATPHEKKKEETLKQFYKSMALATNMKKRKRSTTANDLETKMKDAGDQLIWDALKLTGSQKDQVLTKPQLNQLKSRLISEIGAAYSLEKLRQLLKETVGQ